MIQIGCLARFFNRYEDEVAFAKKNGFDFMQLWYDKNGLALNKDLFPKEKVIKELGFPTIIHAVLNINEIEEHVPNLVEMLEYLEHKEVIIHPICANEIITANSIHLLSEQVESALKKFSERGITLYLENNSRLDPIFNTPEDVELVFRNNPRLKFLLDVAHIESYDHLKKLVAIKMPDALHIADKHFDVIHEHLPIGEGEIDYRCVFTEVLFNFHGKIILEVIQSDNAIIDSRAKIKDMLSESLRIHHQEVL